MPADILAQEKLLSCPSLCEPNKNDARVGNSSALHNFCSPQVKRFGHEICSEWSFFFVRLNRGMKQPCFRSLLAAENVYKEDRLLAFSSGRGGSDLAQIEGETDLKICNCLEQGADRWFAFAPNSVCLAAM